MFRKGLVVVVWILALLVPVVVIPASTGAISDDLSSENDVGDATGSGDVDDVAHTPLTSHGHVASANADKNDTQLQATASVVETDAAGHTDTGI